MSSQAASARFLLLAFVYVAAMLVAFAIIDANAANWRSAITIWGVATVVCGWFARTAFFAALAALAIPLSIPFGTAEKWLGSDAPLILFYGVYYGLVSGIAIVLIVVARWLVEKWWAGPR